MRKMHVLGRKIKTQPKQSKNKDCEDGEKEQKNDGRLEGKRTFTPVQRQNFLSRGPESP